MKAKTTECCLFHLPAESHSFGGQRGNEQVCYSGQVKYFEVINDRNSSINEEIIGNLAGPRHRAQAFKYLTEKTPTPIERVFFFSSPPPHCLTKDTSIKRPPV